MKVYLGGVQCASSVGAIADLIQVSAKQKRSGLCVSIIPDRAAKCRG